MSAERTRLVKLMQWLTPPLVVIGVGLVLLFVAERFSALPQVEVVGQGFAVAAWLIAGIGVVWTVLRLIRRSPNS